MSSSPLPLYVPLDFAVLRAPLLPVDTLDALGDGELAEALSDEVRAALAVASLSFSDALATRCTRPTTVTTLRRYLIRMSTRPTPLGLFAGVAVARWGPRTDLELAEGRRPQRTRPDAGWLMAIVERAEGNRLIRPHLRLVTNRAAVLRAGRVVLAEGDTAARTVSVRATDVVRKALFEARGPIRYRDLVDRLLERTPGATPEQVQTLLDELLTHTLLLSELRPAVSVASPATHLLERLSAIPAASAEYAALSSTIAAAAQWDAEPEPDESGFRAATALAREIVPTKDCPLQVDSALTLASTGISKQVADEAARAAETLLRLSPAPRGPAHLQAYRRLFEQRYGPQRTIPVLEMLDPNAGLGPLPVNADAAASEHRAAPRNRALLDLALAALRGRRQCVDLDETMVRRLQGTDVADGTGPMSLDLTIVVAAQSRAAIDAGDFELAIGPSVGSMSAGRMLGRFADFVPGADAALREVASHEAADMPDQIIAELTYLPRPARLANVAIRPNTRKFEIPVGVMSSLDADHTIPIDELNVGVRAGRFHLEWTRTGQEVVVAAGHALNPAKAPQVCRFLSEVGRDGVCQLSGFSWGPASSFPVLPRVRRGRVVLSLARWRIDRASFTGPAINDLDLFRNALDDWRAEWAAPPRLAITARDRHLALDLDRAADVDVLRDALLGDRNGTLVLTEVFPIRDHNWLTDSAGRRFSAELVVPLALRVPERRAAVVRAGAGQQVEMCPPGGEWLFTKLYCGPDVQDDLLAGPFRDLARDAATAGFTDWFFIRYSDPRRHIRLRFRGAPDRLLAELLPRLTDWAADLISCGACLRFAIDTYEREVHRFGGADGLVAAENLFCADSAAVADLLELRRRRTLVLDPLPLAVRTVDALLAGLAVNGQRRSEWCAERAGPRRQSGVDYREWKAVLRPLVGTLPPVDTGAGDVLDPILVRLRTAGARFAETTAALADSGCLTGAPAGLLPDVVHLHLNRLLGADRDTEQRVYGLLHRLYAGLDVSGAVQRIERTATVMEAVGGLA